MTALQGDVTTLLSKSVIKSVQRGSLVHIEAGHDIPYKIPISDVDLNKALLVANLLGDYAYYVNMTLAKDSILLQSDWVNDNYVTIHWQVIEFY